MACLFLLKDYWDLIEVHWVNTGAAIDQTISQMELIKNIVPNFKEIEGDQPRDLKENGSPVDVLIGKYSRMAAECDRGKAKYQLFYECCAKNLWQPAHKALIESGATLLIRGQKESDHHKPRFKSGDVVDGLELLYPIENWSDSQVYEYLEENGIVLPHYYEDLHTSMDCWNCTAYLHENMKKIEYFRKYYPDKARYLESKVSEMIRDTQEELVAMVGFING